MIKPKCVRMIQTSQCKWHIENLKGNVLTEDITIGIVSEAEKYVQNYISSYLNWTYELVPIKQEGKGEKEND